MSGIKKPLKINLQGFSFPELTELNSMVPRAGIEPALPKKLDFESNVSTSFTTPAQSSIISKYNIECYYFLSTPLKQPYLLTFSSHFFPTV